MSLTPFHKGLLGTGVIMAISWVKHAERFAQKQDSTGSETPSQIQEYRDGERRRMRESLIERFGDKVEATACTERPS